MSPTPNRVYTAFYGLLCPVPTVFGCFPGSITCFRTWWVVYSFINIYLYVLILNMSQYLCAQLTRVPSGVSRIRFIHLTPLYPISGVFRAAMDFPSPRSHENKSQRDTCDCFSLGLTSSSPDGCEAVWPSLVKPSCNLGIHINMEFRFATFKST